MWDMNYIYSSTVIIPFGLVKTSLIDYIILLRFISNCFLSLHKLALILTPFYSDFAKQFIEEYEKISRSPSVLELSLSLRNIEFT
jgi:hypothetical protein